MSQRRLVRVVTSFFDRLDELFPPERSPAGTPSATDFLLHEMPAIIDRLATDYQDATLPVHAVPGLRVFITAGALVPDVAVYAALAMDGSVEVVYLDIGEQ